jgi:hypothetical protein
MTWRPTGDNMRASSTDRSVMHRQLGIAIQGNVRRTADVDAEAVFASAEACD